MIDFGVGDPREETPAFIRDAFAGRDRADVLATRGRPACPSSGRRSLVWVERRFGVPLDPDRQILPTLGSKELVFSLAQVVLDPAAGKDTVVVTAPGYTIPERGAGSPGRASSELPLSEANGFLPDLDAVDDDTWHRTALLWLNYPNNPTGAVAPLAFLRGGRRAVPGARRRSSPPTRPTASSGSATGRPPARSQLADLTNVVAINTLVEALLDDRLPERVRGRRSRR